MLQNNNTYCVLKVFFDYPTTQLSLKEICVKTKLSHPSVMIVLTQLLKESHIIKEKKKLGSRIFPLYSANRTPEFIAYKKWSNVFELQQSGICALLDLKGQIPIILFGSYAKGTDDENSDIDLYIGEDTSQILLPDFKMARKMQLFGRKIFADLPVELKNNILNGIVLQGKLDVYTMKVQISPDVDRAKSLMELADGTILRLTKIGDDFPTQYVTDYYGAIHNYLQAIAYCDGVMVRGDGAHKELISYVCLAHGVSDDVKYFLQDLRELRNDISYIGRQISAAYVLQQKEKLVEVVTLLKKILVSILSR